MRKVNRTKAIHYFTAVGLVTWPLNGSEAGVDPSCFDKELTAFVVQIKLFLC